MTGTLRILFYILVTYLIFGFGYAALTPDWQNPDEPAHYNFIRHLAETGNLPALSKEDYDQIYLENIIQRGFPPELPIDSLRYEAHQPPLYYLLALPVYEAFHGNVFPLRILSLLMGACLLIVTYLIGSTIAPQKPILALSATATIALIPQHTAMMASINNDALAELLMVLVLWFALRERLSLSTGRYERTLLGIAVGLSFLTKLTVAIGYPVAAFALLSRLKENHQCSQKRQHRYHIPWIDLILVLVLPLLIAIPWWVRNVMLYGWPDLFGLLQHASVVALQPKTADWIAVHGFLRWFSRLLTFTFQSFWGQFGWMAVPMRPLVYLILFGLCSIVTLSWAAQLTGNKRTRVVRVNKKAKALLFFSFTLTMMLYLGYNYSYVQHQGRYLYSAIVPFSLALTVGWDRLFCQLGYRNSWHFIALAGMLIYLNLYVLLFVIQTHQ